MSGNYRKEDLRIIKTHKALNTAMLNLLECRHFNQITVNDLCEEAQISRTTFYSHFNDKYDLLKFFLESLKTEFIEDLDGTSELSHYQIGEALGRLIHKRSRLIVNLADKANLETTNILHDFMLSLLEMDSSSKVGAAQIQNSRRALLYHFCAGGMVNLILWQVTNKNPGGSEVISAHMYELLKYMLQWDEEE